MTIVSSKATIFFDLDGTLVRSDPGIINGVRHVLRTLGLQSDAPDLTWVIGPTLDLSFPKLGVPPDQVGEALRIYRERYDHIGYQEAEVFDGIKETLTFLKNAGYALNVATSKPLEAANFSLTHLGLIEFFDYVFGAKSEGHPTSKKDVLLRHALEVTGAQAAHSIMIGDREYDVMGGKANGLAVIGVSYGYGQPGEMAAARPDAIVADPVQLPEQIKSLETKRTAHAD